MLFFFSSRRRHTRYWRDWSSDVCSSDLWLRFWRTRLCSSCCCGGRPGREGCECDGDGVNVVLDIESKPAPLTSKGAAPGARRIGRGSARDHAAVPPLRGLARRRRVQEKAGAASVGMTTLGFEPG